MKAYALEGPSEVDRLEAQSKTELYDYAKELEGILDILTGPVLDAGCGSGVLSRYIATQKPHLPVVGCDFSAPRIEGAKKLAAHLQNIEFTNASILELPFSKSHFGSVVCRFVIEHFKPDAQKQAISEMFRCLKPGGRVCLIDLDGLYHNLYPQPKSLKDFLNKMSADQSVDLQVGRRLPFLLTEAGFTDVQWKVDVMNFNGKHMQIEAHLMRERLLAARTFLSDLLGSEKKAVKFEEDFLETMGKPGAVLFYNKFIVTATKPTLKLISD